MEFKRINKDTVTCIITEDDMDEQGIKLEDLFEKKKEAMDFLHEVMRKAEEEVDYRPTGTFLPMQINVLPDHSISLTLSENATASFGEILKNLTEKAGIKIPKSVLEDLGDSVDEERLNRLNEYLKSLKNLTSSVKNIMDENNIKASDEKVTLSSPESSARSSVSESISTGVKKRADALKSEKERNAERLKFHEYMFTFTNLRTIIAFCSKVPAHIRIHSALYKNKKDGQYYLYLKRGSVDPKLFASLFTMAYEFGHFKASNENVIAYIRENYECILSSHALETVAFLT
ncbi:MAG: adaptor protein MecA [Butyrivibrio sp.]|nr:adaptor protein MecA [Butyrivibrio sp.]